MFQGQYFAGANQPYPFIPIPLTPGPHSQAPSSDDLSNTTSPPEGYADFPGDQNFGHVDFSQFNPQPTYAAGPPTPPNQPPMVSQAPQFVNGHLKQAEIVQPPPTKVEAGLTDEQQLNLRAQPNSEEDELTPAQSRRKAQNRAAQRAFRERKERHVKELEQALATLKESQQETATENERLKRELQKMSTENEILRATREMQGANGSLSPEPTVTGPMQYNPTDFYSNVLQNHTNKTPSHRIVTSDDGERLLAAGATWDFIISHELYKRGLVDVGDVSERLKHQARCDGQGPVFSERTILEAIESSVASGSDELL